VFYKGKFSTLSAQNLVWMSLWVVLLAGCAQSGPGVSTLDRLRAFTPLFADNRVYFVEAPMNDKSNLVLQGDPISSGNRSDVVAHGDPLSIIVNSVEMPQQWPKTIKSKTIDVAVILDLASAPAGGDQSIVVWYQRGVLPGQSLNFSNLLVYFEPRWDERVAPMFRVRVLNVTDERNAEALTGLERVRQSGSAIANLIASPIASPLFSIATRAAELAVLSQRNTLLLDYTVQFYSAQFTDSTTGAGLGALRRGSFVVVGRPNDTTRNFWGESFSLERRSRIISGLTSGELSVPITRVTVGTFESIVPKIVIERSNALTQLLQEQSAKVSMTQLEQHSNALNMSIKAFTTGERIRRFGISDITEASSALQLMSNPDISEEDTFFLLRSFNGFLKPSMPCSTKAKLAAYIDKHGIEKGKACDGS